VTEKLVRQRAPDVAVVATGARFRPLAIDGTDRPEVTLGDWLLPEQIPPGQRVVVISAERAGLVLAERLAVEGRDVTIVGEGKIGPDVIPTFKWRHAAWIQQHGIEALTHATVDRIDDEGVHVTVEDTTRVLPADRVIVAGPRLPVNELAITLEFSVDELRVIGDAVVPRSVANAVHEGFRTGAAL
jgi:2,4-dienoyl-CoA reductase (NADPH2)